MVTAVAIHLVPCPHSQASALITSVRCDVDGKRMLAHVERPAKIRMAKQTKADKGHLKLSGDRHQ